MKKWMMTKGGEVSSMALAMEREPTAYMYRSLLMVAGMVLVDPEPMLARLVRGCIALSFTARVPADQSSHKGTFVSSVLYNAIQCKSQQTYRKIRYPLK